MKFSRIVEMILGFALGKVFAAPAAGGPSAIDKIFSIPPEMFKKAGMVAAAGFVALVFSLTGLIVILLDVASVANYTGRFGASFYSLSGLIMLLSAGGIVFWMKKSPSAVEKGREKAQEKAMHKPLNLSEAASLLILDYIEGKKAERDLRLQEKAMRKQTRVRETSYPEYHENFPTGVKSKKDLVNEQSPRLS